MVYLGLSQDETLKNYRLLGHRKGLYPPRVESFAQSDIFLPFHLKWLFLKDPPPRATTSLLECQRAERVESIQSADGENLVNFLTFSLQFHHVRARNAGPQRRRTLICISSFSAH